MLETSSRPSAAFAKACFFCLLVIVAFSGIAFADTHYCDVQNSSPNIQLRVRPEGGGTTKTYSGFLFQSQTGGCTLAGPKKENFLKADEKYSFCPSEGWYEASARAYSQSRTGSYQWDSEGWSSWSRLYEVDYDAEEEWCDCGKREHGYGYEWFSGITAGNGGGCCGDDDVSDYFESSGAGNSCCIQGSQTAHEEISATNYLCLDGEINVCGATTPEAFDSEFAEWEEAGSFCCTDSGWQSGPCPKLSITQVSAYHVEADDDVTVRVECYRGAEENTEELVDIEIANTEDESVTLYFGQLKCGEEKQFDTTGQVVGSGLYVVSAKFHFFSDCDNCKAYGYFTIGQKLDLPSPDVPVFLAIAIGFCVLLVSRKRKKQSLCLFKQ